MRLYASQHVATGPCDCGPEHLVTGRKDSKGREFVVVRAWVCTACGHKWSRQLVGLESAQQDRRPLPPDGAA